jgi:hypothetical protein
MRRELGKLRSEWSGMPALAEVAGVTQPPTTTGTRVRERDFSAVPEASHGFQRDCGAPLRGVLPLDPQELRVWLHRSRQRGNTQLVLT